MTNLLSTPWHLGDMIAFDTETTGVSTDYDRIVTATVVHIRGAEVDATSWLINPGVPIPAEATAVHKITDAEAQTSGQAPAQAIAEIAAAIATAHTNGHPVIAFNASFDFTILERECRRYGVAFTMPYVIDPFVIDKHLDKWRRGSRKLDAVCAHYGVRLDNAHDAKEDALAAARVAWRLAETFPADLQVPLPDLHAKQQEWRATWAKDFQEYLRTKKGETDAVISPDWPLQVPPADWTPQQAPAERVSA